MANIERYRRYFTKECLMGPNSFRLLDELIRRRPGEARFDRTLDLGCGMALTSLFIANETDARTVFAYDLWISATDNYRRIAENGLADRIIPIHGDAMAMPFAHDYFDAIVSVDAYHYFGCERGVFSGKILPFLKLGGCAMIVVPGLKRQPEGDIKALFEAWAEGDDAQLFKTLDWWRDYMEGECGDSCDIVVEEGECYDAAWRDWFDTGHEYGLRDRDFLERGLYDLLNFALIYVTKR